MNDVAAGLAGGCRRRQGRSTVAQRLSASDTRTTARPFAITGRDLLRNGAVGAGLLAAGPVIDACASSSPGPSSSPAGGAGKPKRGGTLNFGRDTGPTQLDPANSIVGGDVYTLDKIFQPPYIPHPARPLPPRLAPGPTLRSPPETWTLPPPPRPP